MTAAERDLREAPFRPLRSVDGYPPLEDHGLIGDGRTAALVARDGAVSWMCVPRFDSPPLFCRLLDAQRGGAFVVALEGLRESRQAYVPETAVLVTEMRSDTAAVRVTDALLLRAGSDLSEGTQASRSTLVRSVEVLAGRGVLRVEIEPHGGAELEERGHGFRVRCAARPDLELWVSATPAVLRGRSQRVEVAEGDRLELVMHWGSTLARAWALPGEDPLAATVDAWRRWAATIRYDGPQRQLVRRSAITLKTLDHFGNGAIVAAPTSSLPEEIGGERNWDYRYSWVRDAAFSVYALNRIGLEAEAVRFLGWVIDAFEAGGVARVLYDLDGGRPPPERLDPSFEGYRRSRPVRWGNAAADQTQHDVYGETVDCAYQWTRRGGQIDARLWARLQLLVEAAAQHWRTPDHGIWEVRTEGRAFTYSVAMCHVALDRGARLAEARGEVDLARRWAAGAARIRNAILEEAWDPGAGALAEHLGGKALDASALALPLRRVLPADHPRMLATTDAVIRELGAGGGLLYRYLPHRSPDGLAGHEGAFLLCSFWLVEALTMQGRLPEASDLYDSLCGRANDLGLLPEEIDPATGAFLGNFPQAFSHVGVVSAGFRLARAFAARRG